MTNTYIHIVFNVPYIDQSKMTNRGRGSHMNLRVRPSVIKRFQFLRESVFSNVQVANNVMGRVFQIVTSGEAEVGHEGKLADLASVLNVNYFELTRTVTGSQ